MTRDRAVGIACEHFRVGPSEVRVVEAGRHLLLIVRCTPENAVEFKSWYAVATSTIPAGVHAFAFPVAALPDHADEVLEAAFTLGAEVGVRHLLGLPPAFFAWAGGYVR